MKEITLKILGIIAVVLAIIYLIYYSNFKYYWHDEVFGLLHLSGYSREELVAELYRGGEKTQADLHKFQVVNDDKNLQDTIQSLAKSAPHQPPLYFILLWLWAKIFGNSDLAFRSLSIVIWLGFLVSVYYLSLILFSQRKIALIATILVFLSPRFLNYAVDIWEYGLYALMTVWSSVLFLQAFKSDQSRLKWIFYGISLVAGLYTHIFFILVGLAHFIYFWLNVNSINKLTRNTYLFVLTFSICLYLPWLQYLNLNSIYSWAKVRWSLSSFVTRWLNTILGIFDPVILEPIYNIWKYLVLLLVCLSLFALIKTSTKQTWSFLSLIIFVPFLCLVLWDLTLGARYSSVGRFYLPSLLGILLSISYLIGQGITANKKLLRQGSYILLIFLITSSIIAKILPGGGEVKFSGYGSTIPNAAAIVNQAERPLVICERWEDLFPLSYEAKEATRYLLIRKLDDINIKENYSHIYVLSPSSSLQQEFEQAGIQLEKTSNQALLKYD